MIEQVKSRKPSPLLFFDQVYNAYHKAEKLSGGSNEYFYSIAQFPVRLRFAGPALISSITPALEHLAVSFSKTPALTICVWDSVSTGTEIPSPPWNFEDYGEKGEVRGFNNDRIKTFFQLGSNALTMIDLERNLAIFWVRSVNNLPYYIQGAPLLFLFHAWFDRKGVQLVHAGALGIKSGGVLLAGKSGSGKSTICLSSVGLELRYLGDDYCLVDKKSLVLFSLYNSGKLVAADVSKFSFLNAALSNREKLNSEKGLFFLYPHFSDKLLTSAPLRAILISRFGSGRLARLTPASAADALRALAPSTIFQLPAAGTATLSALLDIVKSVPVFYLDTPQNDFEAKGTHRIIFNSSLALFINTRQHLDQRHL